jgi:ADP-ribose pyrophosphatase
MREKLLGSRVVFEGKILRVRVDDVEASDGHRSTREVVEHRGAVGVVVIHDGHVVLVRQYRHPTGEELLEIPAGKLEEGEDPEATAHRELVEEVGLRAKALEHLATYYTTPGFSNELFYLYIATDLVPEAGQTEAGEVIEVERYPVDRIRELIDTAQVTDAKTLLGLALYLLRR